jgi:sulfonate transport system substrate-binding protein
MTDAPDHARRRTLRNLLALLLASTPLTIAAGRRAAAAVTDRSINIGWQKGGSLAVIKVRGALQQALAAKSVSISWLEFPAGPQMLEALNVGSIDLGMVGETPPIFAQAAGADLLYVGNDPAAPRAEALLVPKGSAVRQVADLRGKRVALNRGSNVHYLLVKLLQKAGLAYHDIEAVYLVPADARAAFESGAIDAWVIWDPYAAAVEARLGARILADGTGTANNYTFYIASRRYAERHPDVLELLLHEINAEEQWITSHLQDAAAIIAPQIGVPQDVAALGLSRYVFGVAPLTEQVVRQQQQIADTFYELKLVPRHVEVAAAVWRPPKSAERG